MKCITEVFMHIFKSQHAVTYSSVQNCTAVFGEIIRSNLWHDTEK